MEINWYIVLATGIIPNILGFVWYGPLFGKLWIAEAGVNPQPENVNMVKMMGLTLLFGVLLSVGLTPIVIHQMGVQSVLMSPDFFTPDSEVSKYFSDFMAKYGDNYRTFKHGALHGAITGIFLLLPVMGCNALYESKSLKYVLLNVGFWTLCATLMGGIICAFA